MEKSTLNEIISYVPKRNRTAVIEARAQHALISVINLLESIYESYPVDQAELLHKKILNAIRVRDPQKFFNKIKVLEDDKD